MVKSAGQQPNVSKGIIRDNLIGSSFYFFDKGAKGGRCPFDNDKELNGKTVGQVADERGIAAEECAWQLCQRPQLSACWLAMREEEVRQFMRSPHVIVGTDSHLRELNDGHCHPRCYGVYPRVLGRYVRDGDIITLPQAVHKMTQMPAEKYGIRDRGVLPVARALCCRRLPSIVRR